MHKNETVKMLENGKENVGVVRKAFASIGNQMVQSKLISFPSGSSDKNKGKENISYFARIRRLYCDSPRTTSPKQESKRSKLSTGSPSSRTPLNSKNEKSIPSDSNFGKSEFSDSLKSVSNALINPSPQQLKSHPPDTQVSASQIVMRSIELGDSDPLLIGDYSRRHALPILGDEKLAGLKEISEATLSALISGDFGDLVDRYDIIDCRYPYEYAGGHIKCAINLYTQKQIYEKYFDSKIENFVPPARERVILIFHCEFSSERGPQMCRFLRETDRKSNEMSYPALHYPEVYVLRGGYKLFFGVHPEHCEPKNYTPMDDPTETDNLRFYRNESKNGLMNPVSSKQLKGKGFVKRF